MGALWYQGENDCFTCECPMKDPKCTGKGCATECTPNSCGNILNKTGCDPG